ncbi:hypothetical protein B0H34DRAFT_731786 [Crassisporium funariophilum]|nr:hypothetical protein B0H34DRAFT_731786 [Crassisporium funariophilum]
MLAPPAPGKRPEKLRFNLGLLFTDEGVEYSIQEARARSMGLLGKKWGPPPTSESSRFSTSTSSSSSSLALVDFNDSGQKSSRPKAGGRRSFMGGAEPTVTINTKEALADVFGMYNSPEKTTKLVVPGSKHAPLKKIEPATPVVAPRATFLRENENAPSAKTPTPAFRPFSDENAQPNPNRATPAAKFTPFMDSEQQQHKTPFTTPRAVLSLKDSGAPPTNPRLGENAPRNHQPEADPVFSKVFTPASKSVPLAPLRDVFTDDHGKPLPKAKAATHERAKSHHEVVSSQADEAARATAFTPFKDENARTPFKVFSRPPEHEDRVGNAFTPKTPSAAFAPFVDSKPPAPAFTPFKDTTPAFKPFVDEREPDIKFAPEPHFVSEAPVPSFTNTVIEIEDDEDATSEEHEHSHEQDPESDQDQYYEDEDSHIDDQDQDQYDVPLAPEHLPEEYEEGESFQEVPLGGRFGQFNVMTPITERTFEFTSSTARGTPSGGHGHTGQYEAAEAAVRLAAELREEGSEDYDEEDADGRPSLEPLRLSVAHLPPPPDPEIAIIEERTGSLSLLDTLTLSSKFRPTNPCNPFDNGILSSLISRIPTDPHFHDLRGQEAGKLGELQRFAKKSRKTSAGSNNTGVLDAGCFTLTLEGHRFNVTEKLGEGGFGSVFKARDVGVRLGGEDEDEDDDEDDYGSDEDDEDGASMVALKVVKPRNVWEYHALRRLHSILPSSLRRSVVLPHALYAFSDESYLVLDLCPQGMLLNIVNNAASAGVSQPGACLDELLVMFFSIELLRLLEAMHAAGFIHGDLKIDNCLLRLEDVPGGAAAWSGLYQPSGEGGWSYKGLKVIDFGRTIDTRLFPPGQQFLADWATDERDCVEVREGRAWTYQTDYFGLAGIIYCMLFGKYIQASSVVPTTSEEGGQQRYRIATPFKRYWQTDVWNRLFDVLLNPCLVRPGGELPVCDALGGLRKEMEGWLKGNCDRTSNTLKGLLKKVEMSCY